MKRMTYLGALLFGIVWLMPPVSAVAEDWPIKEFKVFKKKPGDLLDSPNPISDDVAREIERWLRRVAQEYESMGFKKPNYSHIDESILNNKQAYKVYVYPFPTGGPAGMKSPCGRNSSGEVVYLDTYMKVDSVRNIKNGKLTTKAYQDLAHELFHAVQNSYDLFTGDCNAEPGRWITVGTAEAVGIEMARKLYPRIKPEGLCQIGIRRYDRELHTDDKNEKGDFPCESGSLDYAASSFWQFLGEYATRKGIYMATEEFSPPDFRYLHNFFRTTSPMGTYAREYAWLDKTLRQRNRYGQHQFGISLHTAYSRFVGTFASYWKHKRRNLYPGGFSSDLAEKEKKWMQWIFGICEEASVTKNASTSLAVEIMPVASRCLKLNFDFTGRVNLTFYATEASQGIDLDSLAISTDGGKKIVERHPAELHPDKLGKFSIDAKSGSPQYLIISNVDRKDPGSTKDIKPTFSIVPEFMSTSMAKAKKAPTGETGTDPEDEELKNAWESRSWTGHASKEEKSSCTRPFEYSSCGPVTEIDLELLPETARLLDEVDEPTMSLERKMRVLDAIEQQGDDQVLSDMGSALMAIRQEDGWKIRITIPQIQPGFSGSIANAHIQVEKAYNEDGSANGFWLAIGPGWVGSCGGPGLGYYPSSGLVSINEFSNNVLNGIFEAKLAGEGESCQSLPIATSISGSFMITDIRWGQPAPELSDDEILDQTIEDTNELLPGLITEDM